MHSSEHRMLLTCFMHVHNISDAVSTSIIINILGFNTHDGKRMFNALEAACLHVISLTYFRNLIISVHKNAMHYGSPAKTSGLELTVYESTPRLSILECLCPHSEPYTLSR